MHKFVLASALLLLATTAVEAGTSRDLLAKCNDQTQLKCGALCVNFLVDPKNCGKCGMNCERSHICVQGGCVCPSTRPNECGRPGRCVNTVTDPMNCGNCGNLCPSGRCIKSVCVGGDDGCKANQMRCQGLCKDIFVDEANCGACGVVCKGGSICVGGGCVCPPNSPDICVPNVCINKLTNQRNCGFCGNVCKLGQSCVAGTCA